MIIKSLLALKSKSPTFWVALQQYKIHFSQQECNSGPSWTYRSQWGRASGGTASHQLSVGGCPVRAGGSQYLPAGAELTVTEWQSMLPQRFISICSLHFRRHTESGITNQRPSGSKSDREQSRIQSLETCWGF